MAETRDPTKPGRKPQGLSRTISVKLFDDDLKRITALAQADHRTVGDLVRLAVRRYLETELPKRARSAAPPETEL